MPMTNITRHPMSPLPDGITSPPRMPLTPITLPWVSISNNAASPIITPPISDA